MITKNEINECIKLLHSDYHNCKIKILKSPAMFTICSIIKGRNWKYIKLHLTGRVTAWYDVNKETVYLPLFSLRSILGDDKDVIKVYTVYCLFHELRHHYQWKRKPRLVKRRRSGLSVEDSSYITDPTERDADRFSERMCMKYKDDINKILDIDFEWNVMGRAFEIRRTQ